MNEVYFMEAGEKFLAHHGVKGMKWGARKRTSPKRDARLQKKVNRKINRGRPIVYNKYDNGAVSVGYDYKTSTRTDRKMASKSNRQAQLYNAELRRRKSSQTKSERAIGRG
nr:MAG TPA: hypothetical protein [Bacteriophage sp.]